MNIWHLILLFAFMTGIMGWFAIPFRSAVTWTVDYFDGVEHDWPWEVASALAMPLAYMFAILEIYLLFFK